MKKIFKKKTEESKKNKTQDLSKFGLLKGFKPSELEKLSSMLLLRKFKPGEVIYKKGFPHTLLYFVLEGKVDIYLETDEGEIHLIYKEANQHFGEVGLFKETDRTASARAVEKTLLLAFTKKDYRDFLKSNARFGVKFLENTCLYLCDIMIENNNKITRMNNEKEELQAEISVLKDQLKTLKESKNEN